MTRYIRSVVASLSWKGFGIALALSATLAFLRFLQFGGHAPPNFVYSNVVITLLLAFCTWVAAVASEIAICRGRSPLYVLPLALVTASAAVAIGQWKVRGLLHLYTSINQPGVLTDIQRTQMFFVAADVAVFGGLAILTYVNRQRAARMLDSLQRAEVGRIQLEQRILESELASARLLLDPQTFCHELDEIEVLFQQRHPGAEGKLNTLIATLQDSILSNSDAIGRLGARS